MQREERKKCHREKECNHEPCAFNHQRWPEANWPGREVEIGGTRLFSGMAWLARRPWGVPDPRKLKPCCRFLQSRRDWAPTSRVSHLATADVGGPARKPPVQCHCGQF